MRQIVLAVCAALLAFGGIEFALRVSPIGVTPLDGYPWMQRDPVFGTVNVPGTYADPPMAGGTLEGMITINASGMRGAPLERGARRRIVCLGDSSTFGIRLVGGTSGSPAARFRADNAYPEYLAALVDAEVVNAGVLGHDAALGLRRFRGTVLDLHPNVIVVRYGFNDHAFPAVRLPEPRGLWGDLFYETRTFEVARLVAATRLRGYEAAFVTPPAYEAALVAFAEIATAQDITVVFVDYPLRPMRPGEHESDTGLAYVLPPLPKLYAIHRTYQQITERVAATHGVPFVRTDDVVTFGDADRVHPDQDGAQAIAKRVAAAVAAHHAAALEPYAGSASDTGTMLDGTSAGGSLSAAAQ